MSKKSARKARERHQARDATSTPTTGQAVSKTAPRGDDFTPVQQPQISEAAKGPKGKEVAKEEAIEGPVTRADELWALPELGEFTKAKAVDDFAPLLLAAKRSGVAKKAAFDEVTPAEKVDECLVEAWRMVVQLFAEAKDGVDVTTAVPLGSAALTLNRSRDFKLGFDGTFTLLAIEQCAAFVIELLTPAFVASLAMDEGVEYDFEIPVPRNLFHGSVIEQIFVQLGAAALPRKDYAYRSSTVYKFNAASEAQKTIIMKKGGVILGKVGKFPVKAANNRTTMETFFVMGSTGVASARDNLRPAVAGALECSKHLVSCYEANSVKRDFVVIKVSYPYSRVRYNAVARLFDQANFKLVNKDAPDLKPLEIFIAPTLIELGHVSGVRVTKPMALDEDEGGEEEELTAIDLTPPALPE